MQTINSIFASIASIAFAANFGGINHYISFGLSLASGYQKLRLRCLFLVTPPTS